MPISGPKVQVPDAGLSVFDDSGNMRFEWQQFFHVIQQVAFAGSRSGPTASRPTEQMDGRWIGMPYYDTDLGYEINLDSVNPDVWHDASGNPV